MVGYETTNTVEDEWSNSWRNGDVSCGDFGVLLVPNFGTFAGTDGEQTYLETKPGVVSTRTEELLTISSSSSSCSKTTWKLNILISFLVTTTTDSCFRLRCSLHFGIFSPEAYCGLVCPFPLNLSHTVLRSPLAFAYGLHLVNLRLNGCCTRRSRNFPQNWSVLLTCQLKLLEICPLMSNPTMSI